MKITFRMIFAIALSFAIAGAYILYPVVALAQTTAPSTTVNLGQLLAPWLEMLIGGIAILIGALLTYATTLLKQRTGIAIQQGHMKTFQTALTNAAGLALNKLADKVGDKTVDVRHPAIAEAILYVNRSAPDAVEYFGLTPAQIAEKIAAKLGVITAPAETSTVNVTNVSK